jgi:GDPmannose 4,6-dehydratase
MRVFVYSATGTAGAAKGPGLTHAALYRECENMKRAIISGINGQDGSYMTEYLISIGYEVHGIVHGPGGYNEESVERPGGESPLFYHPCDTSDTGQLTKLIYDINPDEIYHFESRGRMNVRYDMHEFSGDITGLSSLMVLESMKQSGVGCKFCQSSSCEIFGSTPPPQNELSPFRPHSPYACAKLMSHLSAVNYREAHGLFAASGIFFNHESPRKGEIFVSRKITSAVARIKACEEKHLIVGDLKPERDWGYAPEYMEMMWKIIDADTPCDYVIGTGEAHTVGEFVEEAFSYAGLDWGEHVKIDPRYFRPTDSRGLRADYTKAKNELGWEPRIRFRDLVRIMVDADMRALGLEPPGEGDRVLRERFPRIWWEIE